MSSVAHVPSSCSRWAMLLVALMLLLIAVAEVPVAPKQQQRPHTHGAPHGRRRRAKSPPPLVAVLAQSDPTTATPSAAALCRYVHVSISEDMLQIYWLWVSNQTHPTQRHRPFEIYAPQSSTFDAPENAVADHPDRQGEPSEARATTGVGFFSDVGRRHFYELDLLQDTIVTNVSLIVSLRSSLGKPLVEHAMATVLPSVYLLDSRRRVLCAWPVRIDGGTNERSNGWLAASAAAQSSGEAPRRRWSPTTVVQSTSWDPSSQYYTFTTVSLSNDTAGHDYLNYCAPVQLLSGDLSPTSSPATGGAGARSDYGQIFSVVPKSMSTPVTVRYMTEVCQNSSANPNAHLASFHRIPRIEWHDLFDAAKAAQSLHSIRPFPLFDYAKMYGVDVPTAAESGWQRPSIGLPTPSLEQLLTDYTLGFDVLRWTDMAPLAMGAIRNSRNGLWTWATSSSNAAVAALTETNRTFFNLTGFEDCRADRYCAWTGFEAPREYVTRVMSSPSFTSIGEEGLPFEFYGMIDRGGGWIIGDKARDNGRTESYAAIACATPPRDKTDGTLTYDPLVSAVEAVPELHFRHVRVTSNAQFSVTDITADNQTLLTHLRLAAGESFSVNANAKAALLERISGTLASASSSVLQNATQAPPVNWLSMSPTPATVTDFAVHSALCGQSWLDEQPGTGCPDYMALLLELDLLRAVVLPPADQVVLGGVAGGATWNELDAMGLIRAPDLSATMPPLANDPYDDPANQDGAAWMGRRGVPGYNMTQLVPDFLVYRFLRPASFGPDEGVASSSSPGPVPVGNGGVACVPFSMRLSLLCSKVIANLAPPLTNGAASVRDFTTALFLDDSRRTVGWASASAIEDAPDLPRSSGDAFQQQRIDFFVQFLTWSDVVSTTDASSTSTARGANVPLAVRLLIPRTPAPNLRASSMHCARDDIAVQFAALTRELALEGTDVVVAKRFFRTWRDNGTVLDLEQNLQGGTSGAGGRTHVAVQGLATFPVFSAEYATLRDVDGSWFAPSASAFRPISNRDRYLDDRNYGILLAAKSLIVQSSPITNDVDNKRAGQTSIWVWDAMGNEGADARADNTVSLGEEGSPSRGRTIPEDAATTPPLDYRVRTQYNDARYDIFSTANDGCFPTRFCAFEPPALSGLTWDDKSFRLPDDADAYSRWLVVQPDGSWRPVEMANGGSMGIALACRVRSRQHPVARPDWGRFARFQWDDTVNVAIKAARATGFIVTDSMLAMMVSHTDASTSTSTTTTTAASAWISTTLNISSISQMINGSAATDLPPPLWPKNRFHKKPKETSQTNVLSNGSSADELDSRRVAARLSLRASHIDVLLRHPTQGSMYPAQFDPLSAIVDGSPPNVYLARNGVYYGTDYTSQYGQPGFKFASTYRAAMTFFEVDLLRPVITPLQASTLHPRLLHGVAVLDDAMIVVPARWAMPAYGVSLEIVSNARRSLHVENFAAAKAPLNVPSRDAAHFASMVVFRNSLQSASDGRRGAHAIVASSLYPPPGMMMDVGDDLPMRTDVQLASVAEITHWNNAVPAATSGWADNVPLSVERFTALYTSPEPSASMATRDVHWLMVPSRSAPFNVPFVNLVDGCRRVAEVATQWSSDPVYRAVMKGIGDDEVVGSSKTTGGTPGRKWRAFLSSLNSTSAFDYGVLSRMWRRSKARVAVAAVRCNQSWFAEAENGVADPQQLVDRSFCWAYDNDPAASEYFRGDVFPYGVYDPNFAPLAAATIALSQRPTGGLSVATSTPMYRSDLGCLRPWGAKSGGGGGGGYCAASILGDEDPASSFLTLSSSGAALATATWTPKAPDAYLCDVQPIPVDQGRGPVASGAPSTPSVPSSESGRTWLNVPLSSSSSAPTNPPSSPTSTTPPSSDAARGFTRWDMRFPPADACLVGAIAVQCIAPGEGAYHEIQLEAEDPPARSETSTTTSESLRALSGSLELVSSRAAAFVRRVISATTSGSPGSTGEDVDIDTATPYNFTFEESVEALKWSLVPQGSPSNWACRNEIWRNASEQMSRTTMPDEAITSNSRCNDAFGKDAVSNAYFGYYFASTITNGLFDEGLRATSEPGKSALLRVNLLGAFAVNSVTLYVREFPSNENVPCSVFFLSPRGNVLDVSTTSIYLGPNNRPAVPTRHDTTSTVSPSPPLLRNKTDQLVREWLASDNFTSSFPYKLFLSTPELSFMNNIVEAVKKCRDFGGMLLRPTSKENFDTLRKRLATFESVIFRSFRILLGVVSVPDGPTNRRFRWIDDVDDGVPTSSGSSDAPRDPGPLRFIFDENLGTAAASLASPWNTGVVATESCEEANKAAIEPPFWVSIPDSSGNWKCPYGPWYSFAQILTQDATLPLKDDNVFVFWQPDQHELIFNSAHANPTWFGGDIPWAYFCERKVAGETAAPYPWHATCDIQATTAAPARTATPTKSLSVGPSKSMSLLTTLTEPLARSDTIYSAGRERHIVTGTRTRGPTMRPSRTSWPRVRSDRSATFLDHPQVQRSPSVYSASVSASVSRSSPRPPARTPPPTTTKPPKQRLLQLSSAAALGDAASSAVEAALSPQSDAARTASAAAAIMSPTSASKPSNVARLVAASRCKYVPEEDDDEPSPFAFVVVFPWYVDGPSSSRVAALTIGAMASTIATMCAAALAWAIVVACAPQRKASRYLCLALAVFMAFFAPNVANLAAITISSYKVGAAVAGASLVIILVTFIAMFAALEARAVPRMLMQLREKITNHITARKLAEAWSSPAPSSPASPAHPCGTGWDGAAPPPIVPPRADEAKESVEIISRAELNRLAVEALDAEPLGPLIDGSDLQRGILQDRMLVHGYYFEDVLVALMLAVVGGLRPTSRPSCLAVAVTMLAITAAHLTYILVLRPLESRVELGFAIFIAVLQVATSVAVVLVASKTALRDDQADLSPEENAVLYIAATLNVTFYAQLAVLTLIEFVIMAKEIRNRWVTRRDLAKQLEEEKAASQKQHNDRAKSAADAAAEQQRLLAAVPEVSHVAPPRHVELPSNPAPYHPFNDVAYESGRRRNPLPRGVMGDDRQDDVYGRGTSAGMWRPVDPLMDDPLL